MKEANFKCSSPNKQYETIMDFLLSQFDTPYWRKNGKLTKTTRFDEDLGISNLDMAMLVQDADDVFGVFLSDNDIDEIKTFDDFAKKNNSIQIQI